jgi:hypothetical protein
MVVDSIRGLEPAPHMGEFRLNSFSAGASNSSSLASGRTDMTAGKATFAPAKVSLRLPPAASGQFYRHLAAGTRLPSLEIRFYNSGNRVFYRLLYESVQLTSVGTEASDEAQLQVEFSYSKARWFAPPDPAGMTTPVQVACWDIAANKVC